MEGQYGNRFWMMSTGQNWLTVWGCDGRWQCRNFGFQTSESVAATVLPFMIGLCNARLLYVEAAISEVQCTAIHRDNGLTTLAEFFNSKWHQWSKWFVVDGLNDIWRKVPPPSSSQISLNYEINQNVTKVKSMLNRTRYILQHTLWNCNPLWLWTEFISQLSLIFKNKRSLSVWLYFWISPE